MGCTIYAASPKALPADEAPGQDRHYQLPDYRHPHGNCSQRIAAGRARAKSMTEQQEQSEETGLLATQDLDHCKDEDAHGHFRFQLIEDLSYEDVKKCYRGSCVSCSGLLQALDVRECVCVYGANVLSLVQSSRPLRERVGAAASGAKVGGGGGGGGVVGGGGGVAGVALQAGRSAKELLMTLPCPSAQTVSKYNSQYHKLFQCVPKEEILMKVCLCISAIKRQCLRRPAQDLHTPSGQREKSELEAVHGGADVIAGRVPSSRRVPGGRRVPVGVEVEEETLRGVRVLLPPRPPGQLHQQPERRRRALQTRAAAGRASSANRQRSFIRARTGPDGVPAAQVLHPTHHPPHPLILLSGLSRVQPGAADVLPQQPKSAPEGEVTAALGCDTVDRRLFSLLAL
uniref:uncharacterized protein gramd2aa isoform X4 n=1 Tax=Gasterosteus aculeatus aculeatus TaxID=481459 RepID=UPI001A986DD5|nr:uncharacterized protein gramd2aa isoform X4 [Gasterosteus aculeatus aculeatus]